MLISTLAAFGQCGFVDFTTTNNQPCVDVNLCDFRFVDRGEDIENIDYRYSIVSNYETHNITFEDYEAFKVQHNSCCTIGGGGGGDIQFPECWKNCKMDVKIIDWGTPPTLSVLVTNPVTEISVSNFPDYPEHPTEISISNFPPFPDYPTTISIDNFPPPVTEISISNLPATQNITGSVSILSTCIEPVFTNICNAVNIDDAAIVAAINAIEFNFPTEFGISNLDEIDFSAITQALQEVTVNGEVTAIVDLESLINAIEDISLDGANVNVDQSAITDALADILNQLQTVLTVTGNVTVDQSGTINALGEILDALNNLQVSIIPEPCKPELIDCSKIYDYTEGGEGGNPWILLSKLPNPHPQAALYGNTFAYIGRTSNQSTHPTLPPVPQSVRGWNIFALCAEEKPFTDSNQHDWLPGPVENYPTVDFFPNSEVFAYPECGSESQCLALQEVKYLQCDGSITYNYMIKSGGVLIPYEEITGDLLYECPQICCTSETKTKVESFGENRFWGYVQPDGTLLDDRDVTLQKIGIGRYQVNLSEDCPTANYPVATGVSESGFNRDVPKAFVETGTQTINSFIIRTTIDDNGQAADIPRDSWFSFHIPKIRNISVIDLD